MNKLLTVLLALSCLSSPVMAKDKPPLTKDQTWQVLVLSVFKLSAKQNHGKPKLIVFCQKDPAVCLEAVKYTGTNKRDHILREIYSTKHKLIVRDVCEFNIAGNSRVCNNFDTGINSIETKTKDGNWIRIQTENPSI